MAFRLERGGGGQPVYIGTAFASDKPQTENNYK